MELSDFEQAQQRGEPGMRHYYASRTPVLLKRAAAHWDFMVKWSRHYLTTTMGDFECTIVRDSRPAFAKSTCSLRTYFAEYSHLSTMTFKAAEPDGLLPPFLKDIPLPNVCFGRQEISEYFFYHSNNDGGSLPHCHQDAFNLLREGRKHWVLYDAHPQTAPAGWELLKRCHEEYGPGTHAKDWFLAGPDAAMRAGVPIYECYQEPGDIMYIPEYFAHAVHNLSETLGMVILTQRGDHPHARTPAEAYFPGSMQAAVTPAPR